MLEREKDIQKLMSEGARPGEIFQIMSEKYSVTPKAIEIQYYKIVNDMAARVKNNRDSVRADLMARNDEIFRKSMAEGKYKTALDANTAQAKLAGLHEGVMEKSKQPEFITLKEEDFSGLQVVGDKAADE